MSLTSRSSPSLPRIEPAIRPWLAIDAPGVRLASMAMRSPSPSATMSPALAMSSRP
jgi:hypothetical protein